MAKKIVSVILAFCMIFSCFVLSPAVFAVDELVYEHSHFASVHGAHLNYKSAMKFIPGKDGAFDTYSLQLDIYSTYALQQKNEAVLSSKDDYYPVDREGAYLVELWGGNGADAVGKGGDGGYVYGIIDNLKKGDILYYTLGSAGIDTNKTSVGGGANGGGGYGANGSNTVGGGGGYSALFLFRADGSENEFEEKYLDDEGNINGNLSEADRTSKYVMIAGGGGGGGSYGTDSNGTADGGAGGYMGSTSGVLSGEYDVAGTFFSGENGRSTGTSTKYVGRGGTNVPGTVVTTTGNAGRNDQPNDWKGSYNTSLEGGAGGSGNYRGGGGGGGFCGGSGGLMTSVILASNVGGGGGGSSFIEESIINTPLTQEQQSLLLGKNADDKNGQIHIVYLGEPDDDYLGDMSVSFARTPYYVFNSVSVETWDGASGNFVPYVHTEENTNNENVEFEPGVDVTKLTFKHLSVRPNEDGKDRDHVRITINFMANPNFAGGNDVPIFMNDEILCVPADSNYDPIRLKFNNHCGYLNVPLNFSVAPRNHTDQGLDPENISHPVTSLYEDLYADVRTSESDDPSGDWRYRFIESIGKHVVKDEKGALITTENVTPDETTRYLLSLTVVPKVPAKPKAEFGDLVTQRTFTGVSVVTVAGTGMATFNGNILVYTKTLKYTPQNSVDYYTIELHVTSDSSGSIADAATLPKFESMSSSKNDYKDFVNIPLTGEYTISIAGGYGGEGGGTTVNLGELTGGNGASGEGGKITATFGLEEGTRLGFVVGKNGASATERYKGANGGECSYVAVVDGNNEIVEYLMIAAGGGGGGGAGSISDGKKGGVPSGYSTQFLGSLNSYNGGNGGDGGFFKTGGNGGTSVSNYLNTSPVSGAVFVADPAPSTATGSDGCSTATLTCLGVGIGGEGSRDNLKSYTVDSYISKYFDVVDATLDVISGTLPNGKDTFVSFDFEGDDNKVLDEHGELLYTKTRAVIDIEPVVLTNITNGSVTSNLGADGEDIYKVDYILKLRVKPKEGFLGGNDVLLIYADDEESEAPTGISITQEGKADKITVDESREYDYANVAIDNSFISDEDFAFETQNAVYLVGGEPVIYSSLVKTLTGLPSGSGWQADYVNIIDPTLDNTPLTPGETTTYKVKAGIEPKVADPIARVRAAVSGGFKELDATVHTNAKVNFELEGIEERDANGNELSEEERIIEFDENKHAGKDYSFSLVILDLGEDHGHHHMPNAITITVGGNVLTQGVDYVYNRIDDSRADVTIYEEKITANVLVNGHACHEFENLYYVFQNEPESTEYTTIDLERHYDEPINKEADLGELYPEDYEHYDLVWDDDGDSSTSIITNMPKQSVWMIGTYVPKTYDITVQYVYENGDKAADSVVEKVSYNKEYYITSPIIEGYAPSITTVSGVSAGNETITVTYTSTEGQLKIVCLYRANGEVVNVSDVYFTNGEYNATLETGRKYDVKIPTLKGYKPEVDSVSGTMTAAGATVYVYYDAETYTVTFDDGIDSTENLTKTVQFGETYGYNADSGMYDGLPTPIRVGYQFEGWAFNNRAVDENTAVNATSDHTLVARWKAMTFTLTVNYKKDDGTEAYASLTRVLDFESTYSFDSPSIRGYTPDIATVSGSVPAQNTVVTVTYNRNTYTVTVQFLYSNNSKDASPAVQLSLKHGDTYEVDVPQISGYYTSNDGETVTGTVDAANVDIVIYYYKDEPKMNFTVSWSGMNFMYNKGTWNPEKLDYEGGYFIPVDDSNKVTVKNEATSNVQIVAEINFTPASEYDTVDGYFTASNQSTAEKITSMSIVVGKEKTAYLHLDGELDERNIPQNFTIGTCTVTVRGG